MDMRIAGLLGAVVAIATMGSSQAATEPVLAPPASHAGLLAPIPNAATLVEALDAARAAEPAPVKVAQYYEHRHHHHHRRWGRHYYGPPCYWTWGRPYWNGFRWVRRHIRVCR
ncbi:MAG: hypothetical protein ACREFB_04440 [Stellaceae bacterium]